jgi:ABC-type uncharacterized transport system substrate-binding protein
LWSSSGIRIDRVFKGEQPRDLPAQLPVRYQFVLNLKTAKAIGLDIPANVLALGLKARRNPVSAPNEPSNIVE